MIRFSYLILFTFSAVTAWAQSSNFNTGAPMSGIQWYEPEMHTTSKGKLLRVLFSGHAPPGSEIKVAPEGLKMFLRSKKKGGLVSRNIPTRKVLRTKGPIVAREDGYFEFTIDLPPTRIQLPVMLSSKAAPDPVSYVLSLQITPEKVTLQTAKGQELKASPFTEKPYLVWFGLGFNYLKYAQDTDVPSDLSYETFKGPSFFLNGRFRLNPNWYLSTEYKLSPGEVTETENSSGTGNLTDGANYSWVSYGLEALYRPQHHQFGWFKQDWDLRWRFGLQHHIMPFLVPSQNTPVDLDENDLTMLTVGFHFDVNKKKKFSYEFFMRYQYPLMSGSLFDVKPQFAFDGSMGVSYKMNAHWWLGVFWYGQWHEYDFDYSSSGFKSTGHQSMIYSNIDLRAGIQF